MGKFWCVTTCFYDNGKVSAVITSVVEAAEKPENSFTNTRDKDIYHDWFGSEEEAKNYVEEAKRA